MAVYTPLQIDAMSFSELLAKWEELHGPVLVCKCATCRGSSQPIQKFQHQLRKFCKDGLSAGTKKPKTCDRMTLENDFFNPINNPYYAERRKLKGLHLPQDVLEARLEELNRNRVAALVIARQRLHEALERLDAEEAPVAKPRPKLRLIRNKGPQTAREVAVQDEAERRLTVISKDPLFEQQVQNRIQERLADDDMERARLGMRALELLPLFT